MSLSSPLPLFYFELNCCPLITCLHRFLTVSHFHSLHSFILFSCPHPVIIYFPSRTASVPTQLLSFPTHRKFMSPNMRKRKCLVVFNFHKVKTETGLHIFKISFMVFIFVSVSESFHRPALSAARLKLLRLPLPFPAEVHRPGESGRHLSVSLHIHFYLPQTGSH